MATRDDVRINVDALHKAQKESEKSPAKNYRLQALDENEVAATESDDTRIQMEEISRISSRSRNKALSDSDPRPQIQTAGNNCNNVCDPQTKSLEEDLIQLSKTSSFPSWSIFKVPHLIRHVNEKAYEPSVISIGPYHHGKEHLKKMEIIKNNCVRRIIGESMDMAKEFVKAMKDIEEAVRKCYPEALDHFDSDAFVKMMILDGCLIVDLFQNDLSYLLEQNGVFLRNEIYYDLLLLENQLPFFVLSKLYSMIKRSNAELKDEFARLALSRLPNLVLSPVPFPKKFPGEIKHLLGLVYDCWIPSPTDTGVKSQGTFPKFIYPTDTGVESQGTFLKFMRCATELEEAGIKFEKKDNDVGKIKNEKTANLLLDIDFTDAKFKIPALTIEDNTERILRSFMAYEQFILCGEPTYVCNYVRLMDNLIDSGKDVQLLCHYGVIVNWLGDYEAVAQMFNKLCDFTYLNVCSSYYKKIYDDVDEHCQKRRNLWKAKLKKDYFKYPWSLISVIAAFVLLLLTVVQTIFSVLS